MQIAALQHIEAGDVAVTRHRLLEKGYTVAYGASYTLDEVKQAIRDGQPVFMEMNKACMLTVGESDKGLYFQKDNSTVPINNENVEKLWNGSAVIVTGQEKEEEYRDFCIYVQEYDTWSAEYEVVKNQVKALLAPLQTGNAYLPDHPMVVYFKEGEGDKRVTCDGITITVYKPDIGVTDDVLMAIGRSMWNHRETDKAAWKKRFNEVHTEQSPLYSTCASEEDYFATLYTWYLKGKIINPGFISIIESTDPRGLALLETLFMNIQTERRIEAAWPENERLLQEMLSKPPVYRMGKTLVKAQVPLITPLHPICIPRSIHAIIKGSTCTIQEGALQGTEVILAPNRTIDIEKTRLHKAKKTEEKQKRYVLQKAKAAEPGTTRTYKNGVTKQKQGDGTWKVVKKGSGKSTETDKEKTTKKDAKTKKKTKPKEKPKGLPKKSMKKLLKNIMKSVVESISNAFSGEWGTDKAIEGSTQARQDAGDVKKEAKQNKEHNKRIKNAKKKGA